MGTEALKPMSVARSEFISALTDLINNSMLPPFVIEPILKDMYHDICIVSKQQLEADTKRYVEQLNSKEETE